MKISFRGEFALISANNTFLATGERKVFTRNDFKSISLNTALVASSSIPLMARPKLIDHQLYFDGGVMDSIPVKYALSNHPKVVVVLTRQRGYRKEKLSGKLFYKMAFRKHPEFLKILLSRNDEYNKTLEFCEQMEQEGKVLILAPSADYSVSRIEKSYGKRCTITATNTWGIGWMN